MSPVQKKLLKCTSTNQKLPAQWISTVNNYTVKDVLDFEKWCEKKTTYSVCGYEVGKICHTPHLQGFHQNGAVKWSTLPDCVWVTPVGKDNGCVPYVQKEGKLAFQCGEYKKKEQGKRTDRDRAAQLVIDGHTMPEIAILEPGLIVSMGRGIQQLHSLLQPKRDESKGKFIACIYGGTGLGKSWGGSCLHGIS